MVLLYPAPRLLAQHPSFDDSLRIDEVLLEGDSAIENSETLLEQIDTHESPGAIATFLWSIIENMPFAAEPVYFDYEVMRQDAERLAAYLKRNGWISATTRGSYVKADDGESVTVTFRIAAGARSYIDSVDYRNLRGLPRELDSLVREGRDRFLMRGAPFSEDNVQAEIDRVLKHLGENGYPVASCDSVTVERLKSSNNTLVRLWFAHGRQLRVGTITRTIKNSDELNLARKIIDDRLEVHTGEVYSTTKRERSELNLNRLGIFTSVQIQASYPPKHDTVQETVPLDVQLTPKQRHELAPAVLVNSFFNRFNAGAEVSYLVRNIFGGAQTMTARANFLSKVDYPIDSYQGILQLRFDQPYLFSNDNSGSVSIAYIRAYESELYGGNIFQFILGMRQRFTDRVQGSADWTLEQSKYDILATGQSLVSTPFAAFDTTGINYRNSIITFGLERDATNDFYNPTAGLAVRGMVEEAGLFKQLVPSLFAGYQSAEYRKLEGMARIFTDLSHNGTAVLGAKLKLGTIFRYGESAERNIPVPFNRRYYAGGSQSVRGWSARTLAAGGQELATYGGNALLEASLEYRWQLFPRTKPWYFIEPANIWLVFFADAGNLWSEPASIRLSEVAGALGLGLRYNMFFGPIRVDYGMKAYDPRAGARAWFTDRVFGREFLARGILLLGIGHAF
ncbi:MAG: BamA/TamA family outer membrane protein [Ignavibacteriae bacterium]|nr:BamA/TamA family outer membrane protein [Ignavibacteriota bacterium]